MASKRTVLGLDEIDRDLEGTARSHDQVAEFFAREQDAVRGWHVRRAGRVRTRGTGQSGAGQRFIARCPADTQRRYQTLLYFEEKARPQDDHAILIAAASQILEAELDHLLTKPARAVVDSLIACLQQRKDRKPAATLERWAARQIPTTIGIQINVLLALRRGCEQRCVPVLEFLAENFWPRYVDLLISKKLGACLDRIREGYRNPACHGTATFDPEGYTSFVRLALAQTRFAAWDEFGPTPAEPGAEVAVLHHHLHLSQVLNPAAVPEQAVESGTVRLNVRVSRQVGPDRYELVPLRGAPRHAATRGLTMRSPAERLLVQTGDRVHIEVQADRTVYLTVYNVGPTGNLGRLFSGQPPAPGAAPTIRADQPLQVLDAELKPPVGLEQVVAVWSRWPLPSRLEELHAAVCGNGAATEGWQALWLELDHQTGHKP